MSYIEWGVLALFLMLMELFVSGVYLLWFGLAGLLLSVGVYFGLIPTTNSVQLVIFSIASCVFASIGYLVYKKLSAKLDETSDYKDLNDLAAQHVGKIVTLTQDVVDGKTKVKVADTVWLAYADEGLKAGDKVVIKGVEKGLIFIVSKE